jgi:formylmethanofuran dehydrogenase subunit B
MSTTQELVERLQSVSEWKQIIERHRRITDDPRISYVLQDGTRVHEDESVVAKLAASLSRALEDAASVSDAAAARLDELERENAALQKERDYAVKWGNAAVESVQEAMWRYQDALRAVFARLDHPGNADQRVQYFLRWPEVKAARAALAGSGEK